MLLENREAGKAKIFVDCDTREKLIFPISKSEELTSATQTEKTLHKFFNQFTCLMKRVVPTGKG